MNSGPGSSSRSADSFDANTESTIQASSKATEEFKKSGEYDKYRREAVTKFAEGGEWKKLIEKCRSIVEITLDSANMNRTTISELREKVKREIKARRIVDNSINRALPTLLNGIDWRMRQKVEDIVRTKTGIAPAKDGFIDLDPIDMEVSSGCGESTANSDTCTKPDASSDNQSSSSSSENREENSIRRCISPTKMKKNSILPEPSDEKTIAANGTTLDEVVRAFMEQDGSIGKGDQQGASLFDCSVESRISSAYTSSLSCNASFGNSNVESPMEMDKTDDSVSPNSQKSSTNPAKTSVINLDEIELPPPPIT